MKKAVIVGTLGVGVLLLLLTMAACGTDLQPRVDELETQVAALQSEKTALEGQKQTLIDIAGPLPASLDQFHPRPRLLYTSLRCSPFPAPLKA
jgi:hypothetical protein